MPATGVAPQWVDPQLHYTLPALIYAGPLLGPADFANVAPMGWALSYVYHLFDASGALIYVGFTGSPLNRWQAHQRKAPWWPQVRYMHAYEVRGKDRTTATNGARRWEHRAIHDALPLCNRLGPRALPYKQRTEGVA